MKTTTVYTAEALENNTIAGLVTIYNGFAIQLERNTIKKFRDKSTGIARIMKIQDEVEPELMTAIEEAKEENSLADEEVSAKQDKTDDAEMDAIAKKMAAIIETPIKKKATAIEKPTKKKGPKATEDGGPYSVGSINPKNLDSAMGIIYSHVLQHGEVTGHAICLHFIEEYSLTYKGKHDVDMGFAKGYLRGAVRAGHLIALSAK